MLLAAWMLVFKLRAYYGLAYTSDLFQFAQLATTWLDGRFLQDNCYGDHLSSHTYFFVPLLALFVVPLGVPGLLVALSLAYGAGFAGLVSILRLQAIPFTAAFTAGAALTVMPLTVHVYEDTIYGFHVDLLLPALGIWLAYFLLRRNWRWAIPIAVAMIAVKEEATIVTAAIASAILAEHLIPLFGVLPGGARAFGRAALQQINWTAVIVIFMAVVSLPFLIQVLHSHTPVGYSIGSFQRLRPVDGDQVTDPLSLASYLNYNSSVWLGSATSRQWLLLAGFTTFGMILLRPHLLAIGIVTSVTAWLM